MKKRIALVGSTGSIGKQVIDVVMRHPERFEIVAMAANSNERKFIEQMDRVRPSFAALRSAGEMLPHPENTRFSRGEGAYEEVCGYGDADVVLIAVTGFAGLKAALLAIQAGKDIALANKESLVVGGDLVMRAASKANVAVVPIDSEHSAIWQCLHFDRTASFSKILLTASGGALRDVPLRELQFVTAEAALAHPNWNMGAKITIDCATMLNKGFEVMEAMHLYGAALEQIEVLIHRESIVHSMVEFEDGAVLAQLGVPSMELPIQLALTYPERIDCASRVDFAKIGALHFEKPDLSRYPCFALALACAKEGKTAPCILNAAGEVAVAAFLNGQIKYTQIAEIIDSTLSALPRQAAESFAALEAADERARAVARTFVC